MNALATNNSKPFLIVQCELLAQTLPALYEVSGDMDDLMRDALRAGDHPVAIARVCNGDPLPDPHELAGVLISGSASMVADADPWIARTAEWLRLVHKSGVPTLGVCFGHQLLAYALGGTVGRAPTSVEYATVTINRIVSDPDDHILGYLPEQFVAQAAHFQIVITTPRDAKILARNDAGIQALRFGPATWGIQFHPELSDRHLRVIIAARGVDVAAERSPLRPSPEAARLIERFRDFVIERAIESDVLRRLHEPQTSQTLALP
jgi:GMP synthase (glutamine-hydrolysing)